MFISSAYQAHTSDVFIYNIYAVISDDTIDAIPTARLKREQGLIAKRNSFLQL